MMFLLPLGEISITYILFLLLLGMHQPPLTFMGERYHILLLLLLPPLPDIFERHYFAVTRNTS
jgi:hypothetical protein